MGRRFGSKLRRLFLVSERPDVRVLLSAFAIVSALGAWEIVANGLWQNEFETEVERLIRNDVVGRFRSKEHARQALRERGNPYSLLQ